MQSLIRKFTVKFLEVAGAGLASALCAYVLGQIERAPAPTPLPAVVYISPANVDTALREDHVGPAATARIEAETPLDAAASAAAPAAKAVKPAAVAQTRRSQKPDQGASVAELKARGGEALAIRPATVAANSATKGAPLAQTAAGRDEAEDWSSGEEDRPLLAGERQNFRRFAAAAHADWRCIAKRDVGGASESNRARLARLAAARFVPSCAA